MIRKAIKNDIPSIEDLLEQVGGIHHDGRPDLFKEGAKKYTRSQLEQMIGDDSRPIFVAVDDGGNVMGYVFCIFEQHVNHNVLTDVKTLYIDDLCVDEKLRGRNIGRQLYDFAANYAEECGCYNLTLNVWSCNTKAVSFYEACGLKPQKVHLETVFGQKAPLFSIRVVLTRVESQAVDNRRTERIYFTAYCESECFAGATASEGCDVRIYEGEECVSVKADYTLVGQDADGDGCYLHITNQAVDGVWKPSVRTDSGKLSWLSRADVTACLEPCRAGLYVRFFVS